MKLVVNVKNARKVIEPSANDIMLYDGKDWYITTKENVIRECSDLLHECQSTLLTTIEEVQKFKSQVATQLYEMSELIKKLYENK